MNPQENTETMRILKRFAWMVTWVICLVILCTTIPPMIFWIVTGIDPFRIWELPDKYFKNSEN